MPFDVRDIEGASGNEEGTRTVWGFGEFGRGDPGEIGREGRGRLCAALDGGEMSST